MFGTDPKEWFLLSEQLAKKDLIRETYFTLDLVKMKQIEKNINQIDEKTKQKIEEAKSSSSGAGAFASGMSGDLKTASQPNDFEPEPEFADKASLEEIFASHFKTVRVKLVITEINNNEAHKKLRNFVSPIMYQIPGLKKEFGIFHVRYFFFLTSAKIYCKCIYFS